MDDPQIYVTEIAELFPPQGLWTEADYLRLPHSTRLVELCAGRLVIAPPHTPEHERVAGELVIALDRFVEQKHLGEVLHSPVAVRLWLNQIRMPDILFVAKGHEARKRKMWLDGPPDWIAEVIAPETRSTDEVDKLADYARAGVLEYWLIDLAEQAIRVYTLDDDPTQETVHYVLVGSYGPGTLAKSERLSGFEVAVDVLFL